MPNKKGLSHSRWHITSRVIAATVFGFVLANSASVLLSFLLPGEKTIGLAWVTLASFVLYTCIVMWVFSVKRLRTVWLGLVGAILLTSAASTGLYILDPTL